MNRLKKVEDEFGAGNQDSYNRVRLEADMEEMNHINSSSKSSISGSRSLMTQSTYGYGGVFDPETETTPFLTIAYLFFIVIASVLGTGILGLPVKLAESGFTPFVASYSLCYVMQVFSAFYLIEILQRLYSIIRIESSSKSLTASTVSSFNNNNTTNNIQLESKLISIGSGSEESDFVLLDKRTNNQDNNIIIDDSNNDGIIINNNVYSNTVNEDDTQHLEEIKLNDQNQHQRSQDTQEGEENTPNLHYLGLKFLGKYSHYVFIFSVVLHFTSVLISYGLAGSEAWAQIFNVQHQYLIVPLILILTCVIIFGSNALQHIITFFTFGKGTLLVTIVLITGAIAHHVQLSINSDWSYIGTSFLISTVALGGASSVLPVVFPKIVFSQKEMRKCYLTVFASLSTVYTLNVIWCWFLLRIIPQMPDPSNPDEPSLYKAQTLGEIATIPLMQIVKLKYPNFLWVARIVDIFIVISISISFITVGNGFKHTLDGFSTTWRQFSQKYYNSGTNNTTEDDGERSSDYSKESNSIIKSIKEKITRLNQIIDLKEGQSLEGSNIVRYRIREAFFYIISFGFILVVAVMNPRGFLMVMENGTSLGLNLQTGTFIVMMLNYSRRNYSNYAIPLPVPPIIFKMRYVVFSYFTFAVIYDLVLIIKRIFT